MTVAVVVLAASVESALADADGLPRVRRIVDTAWSGGGLPIVAVAPDPDGRVAAALAGAPVTLAEPAPPAGGPVAQICRGIDVAAGEVHETTAALVWPARVCWVGPETVTSLIEAHGAAPGLVLRPAYRGEPGWPLLMPVAHVEALRAGAPNLMPDELMASVIEANGLGLRAIELGDPGATIDAGTARADLPPYDGPPEPVAGHEHEWGSPAADRPDDAPLPGPALAPYESAG